MEWVAAGIATGSAGGASAAAQPESSQALVRGCAIGQTGPAGSLSAASGLWLALRRQASPLSSVMDRSRQRPSDFALLRVVIVFFDGRVSPRWDGQWMHGVSVGATGGFPHLSLLRRLMPCELSEAHCRPRSANGANSGVQFTPLARVRQVTRWTDLDIALSSSANPMIEF